MEIEKNLGKTVFCKRNIKFKPYESQESVWYSELKKNSSMKIHVRKSEENLENLQSKTSNSSSKRRISLTNVLKNVSTSISKHGSEKSLNIEIIAKPKPLNENKKVKSIQYNKYDLLRDEINHFNWAVYGRKMSFESLRLNIRPKLNFRPPRHSLFYSN